MREKAWKCNLQRQKMNQKRILCDYLIIGSGLAGMTAALDASRHGNVIIVTKSKAEDCNTRYAQGGISCVVDFTHDSFESHVQDTLTAGAGLCHEDVVREIVKSGPDRCRDLQNFGVRFTLQKDVQSDVAPELANEYHLGREGGHSARRVLHSGDITGREISDILLARCRENQNITILENHLAVDLITTRHIDWQGENCCLGAYVIDTKTHEIKTFFYSFIFDICYCINTSVQLTCQRNFLSCRVLF